jgi:hypothetical protein
MVGRRIRFVTPLVAVSGIVAACTHDFDAFEPNGQSDTSDASTGDSGTSPTTDAAIGDAKSTTDSAPAVDAGPCGSKASCYSTRKTCGDGCTKKKDECYTACETKPGSKNFCRAQCREDEDDCDDACRDTCRSCAKDGCTAACQ